MFFEGTFSFRVMFDDFCFRGYLIENLFSYVNYERVDICVRESLQPVRRNLTLRAV